MARARNIKPGLFRNEILGVADPLLTLLFEGLWVLADRAGKLEDRPLRIQGDVFPYRPGIDMNGMLDWLQANGFIRRYKAGERALIFVCEFVKHQNPHKNEAASILPDPETISAGTLQSPILAEALGLIPDSLIPDSLSTDSLIPEEEKSARKRARPSPIPCPAGVDQQTWEDWLQLRKAKRAPVTETVVAEAQRESIKANLSLQRFLEIWCARGSQGLQAEWLKPAELNQRAAPTAPLKSFAERDSELKAAKIFKMTGGRMGKPLPQDTKPLEYIDMEDGNVQRLIRD